MCRCGFAFVIANKQQAIDTVQPSKSQLYGLPIAKATMRVALQTMPKMRRLFLLFIDLIALNADVEVLTNALVHVKIPRPV
jgi:hypothetical protein